MANKFKTATVAVMTAVATLGANGASGGENASIDDKKINAAARITRGSVLKYEVVSDSIPNAQLVKYHIDQDGDNKADVVRRRIVPDGQICPPRHSPFDIIEINELYDEKYRMWNIIDEVRKGTRKPHAAPQKTR